MTLWRAHPREQLDYLPPYLRNTNWLHGEQSLTAADVRPDSTAPLVMDLRGQMLYVQDEDA